MISHQALRRRGRPSCQRRPSILCQPDQTGQLVSRRSRRCTRPCGRDMIATIQGRCRLRRHIRICTRAMGRAHISDRSLYLYIRMTSHLCHRCRGQDPGLVDRWWEAFGVLRTRIRGLCLRMGHPSLVAARCSVMRRATDLRTMSVGLRDRRRSQARSSSIQKAGSDDLRCHKHIRARLKD